MIHMQIPSFLHSFLFEFLILSLYFWSLYNVEDMLLKGLQVVMLFFMEGCDKFFLYLCFLLNFANGKWSPSITLNI
jgi:hypothetical protein